MTEWPLTLPTIEVTVAQHVALVELNRPEVLNAINMQLYADLVQAISAVEEDPEIWVAILAGRGRAFSVGADLKERVGMTALDVSRRRRLAPRTFGAMFRCRKPVIAAVSGFAIGGGLELALACDLLVADEETVFRLPETRLGVIPGGGATQRLPRLIGAQRAKELIFTGRSFSAREAADWGMLTRLVASGTHVACAEALAAEITSNAPVAVYQSKKAVNASLSLDLESGLLMEVEAYEVCLGSSDWSEAMAALRQKRSPVYTGD